MKTLFLFPTSSRKIGSILFLFGIAFFAYSLTFGTEIFYVTDLSNKPLNNLIGTEGFDNEIQLSLVLIGLILIAFSREKIEDEHIAQLRLDSLQWAVYINYIVFFGVIWIVYDLLFYMVTMYNVFTLLVFFIIRFRWKLYMSNKALTLETREAI
ncbi:hypothetical protein IM792_10645 [Mucilaginibacter sp. JRF]|uniref:hypothetical protein n=1 Tax=Mucilaginibacter sp. JRF TaxID=2780088 RepID=UPI001881114E|nr:hypothetical protein [Mucilaginibacter sp. JRF]MBE9584906.1 hypothetical protein [Mucilaginibacter sp. JRF]